MVSPSDLWVFFHRGNAWWFQLLLRLCAWSPLARWALNNYSTAVPIRFNLMMINLTLNWSVNSVILSGPDCVSSCTSDLITCWWILIWIKGWMWFRLPDQHWNVLFPPCQFAVLGRLAHEVGWKYQAITATLEEKRKEKAKLRYAKKKTVRKLTKQAEKNVETKIAKYTDVLKQYGILVWAGCFWLIKLNKCL